MIDYDSLESIKKMEIEIAFAVRRRPHFHPFFTPLFPFTIESQVRTFYSLSNITPDSQPFLEPFSPVFGFLCHNMNRFDTKCYPVLTEGRKQPLKPKIKHC